MSDVFGNQTLTFIGITDGVKDKFGIPTPVPVEVEVENCRFRPLTVEETVNLTDVSTEVWKATCPPDAVVLAAKTIDQVRYNDITYEIMGGIKPFAFAESSAIYKVTVMCKVQNV